LDVDVATDLMIHDIELIMKLMGEVPKVLDVQGESLLTKTWDYVNASFGFSAGRTATITVSRCHPTAVRSLFVVDSHAAWLADLGTGELQKVTRSTRDPQSPEVTAVEKTTVEKHDAMLLETQSFFESVRDSKEPAISGEQGLKAMEVLETVLGRLG
jgi:predicted dehydrogenase